MKLIIGIGNPGKKYKRNRHNVGFMIVDRFIKKLKVSPHIEKKHDSLVFYHHESKTIFARPQTYMNESGKAVSSLATFYKLHAADIYIIYDDLDITLGEYKIQKGKGPKEHKGILSIYEKLGSKDFWHVRVGVDNRNEKFSIFNFQFSKRMSGEKYVLQDFTGEEGKILEPVIDRIVKDLYGRIKVNP